MGHFREAEGTISAPIGRHPVDRKKIVCHRKEFQTCYNALYCDCRISPCHAFTAAIGNRTHTPDSSTFSVFGSPDSGDDVYGKAFPGIEGQCLHAAKIGFIHPSTGQYLEFESPLPEYFEKVLRKLKS